MAIASLIPVGSYSETEGSSFAPRLVSILFTKDKIIAAAENRRTFVGTTPVDSGECSIIPLSQSMFFIGTGVTSRWNRQRTRKVWDANDFAIEAFRITSSSSLPGSVIEHVANEWAVIAKLRYQNLLNPMFRSSPFSRDIVRGLFAGSDADGRLKLYVVNLALQTSTNRPPSIEIRAARRMEAGLGLQDLGFDARLSEFIKGKTARAKLALRKYRARLRDTREDADVLLVRSSIQNAMRWGPVDDKIPAGVVQEMQIFEGKQLQWIGHDACRWSH